MPGQLIASLDQVTPAWLTEVLTHQGALTAGAVAAFESQAGRGNWSRNAILHLHYSAGAQGALPPRLFLKIVTLDLEDEFFGPSEVLYYTRDYVDVADAPLIRCYDAVYAAEEQRYHLLLEDVSTTHVEATTRAPTLAYGEALVEGLARLHARWWGGARLAQADAPIHDADHIQRFVDIAAPGVSHIVAHVPAELKSHWPAVMQRLYATHSRQLIARTHQDNGFTLIHGDAGVTNILVPRQGERPLYLIDRQPFNWSLTTWLGVYDLVYAMVLDWEVEARRRWEMPVLRYYHQTLQQRGVTGYTWEQLVEDYRLCVPMGVYIATEYCRGGLNRDTQWVWLPMLQRALTACDDLGLV